MNVIALKRLREFWEIHADSEQALKLWYHTEKKANWQNFNEITEKNNGARPLGNNRVSFKIKGNAYRIIVNLSLSVKSYIYVL